MFVKNLQKVDIEDNAYAGFYFTMPANQVCAIWTEAGEDFLKRFAPRGVALDENQQPVKAPLVSADRADWKPGVYATVRRFPIDASRVQDRVPLIALAKERGISNDRLKEYETNPNGVSMETIVAEINKLPIPEEIRFPEKVEVEKVNENN